VIQKSFAVNRIFSVSGTKSNFYQILSEVIRVKMVLTHSLTTLKPAHGSNLMKQLSACKLHKAQQQSLMITSDKGGSNFLDQSLLVYPDLLGF
jgi:hypothetical protein